MVRVNQFKAGCSQTGSIITTADGNIDISAQNIDINAAMDTHQNGHIHTHEKSGLTVAVTAPVVSAVQQAAHAVHTIGESKNNRVNAMAAMNSSYDSYKAAQSIGNLTNPNPQANSANIKVCLTHGQQKANRKTTTKV